MRDNQSFSWEGLLALAVTVGVSLLFILTSAPFWLVGAVPVALTAILLVWHGLALGRQRAAGTVILARSPWLLLGATTLLAMVAVALTEFIQDRAQSSAVILLSLFFGGLFYVAALPTTLLAYVADGQGLSRQVLSFRKLLPWSAIDWIYAQQNRVSANAQVAIVDIPVFRWTEKTIILEAGPQRHLRLLTSAPLAGGDPTPLVDAIRARATNALIGFEQLPAVNARRANTRAGDNRPTYRDLPTAITLARGGTLSEGCTLFPALLRPIWTNLVSLLGLGIVSLGAGIYAVLADNSLLLQLIPSSFVPTSLLPFFPGLDTAVFALLAVVLLAVALPWIRALRDPGAYFLLVAPDGFAVVRGPKVTSALFAQTKSIEVSNGGFYGPQLKTMLRDGKTLEIEVNIFGRSRDLLAYILAARANASPSPSKVGPLGTAYHTEQDVG